MSPSPLPTSASAQRALAGDVRLEAAGRSQPVSPVTQVVRAYSVSVPCVPKPLSTGPSSG